MEHVETLTVGGSAGAVVAARLSEDAEHHVALKAHMTEDKGDAGLQQSIRRSARSVKLFVTDPDHVDSVAWAI